MATAERAYLRSHPWINFKLNMRELTHLHWALLGEARSKFAHLRGTPLRPETAEQLHQLFLVKGVLGTAAIEGNTLSEDEVLRHLEGRLELPPSREYLKTEIDNIVRACNEIAGEIFDGNIEPLSVELISRYNAMVLQDLEVEEGVVPGAIRKGPVGVARYLGAPAEDCEHLLDRLCDWLGSSEFTVVEEEMREIFAIIRAALAHLYVAWIHPYGDGNGRTARLLEFRILVVSGVPTPAAHLLSNHYNLTRADYYRQLDAASRSGGDLIPFLEYAVRGLVEGLREQLEIVSKQHHKDVWTNYVHDQFKDKTSLADQRKRHLVLDLSDMPAPVQKAKLRELTPRLASAYAGRTPKTLSRDVNDLIRMNLIGRDARGYFPRRDLVHAFLPRSADSAGLV